MWTTKQFLLYGLLIFSARVWLHALYREISGISLHLWSESRGCWGASCWVMDVTCGTELHAVRPWSGHSSCSENSAWLKSKYSNLPKVTGFHRTTMCSSVTYVGSEIGLLSFIILWLNYGVVTLQLISNSGGGGEHGTFLCPAGRKGAVFFLQSVYHATFLL